MSCLTATTDVNCSAYENNGLSSTTDYGGGLLVVQRGVRIAEQTQAPFMSTFYQAPGGVTSRNRIIGPFQSATIYRTPFNTLVRQPVYGENRSLNYYG